MYAQDVGAVSSVNVYEKSVYIAVMLSSSSIFNLPKLLASRKISGVEGITSNQT